MRKRSLSFRGIVQAGHKQVAIEVPFDPAEVGAERTRLRPGRFGYRVVATINGRSFRAEIVPRARRFWLTIPDEELSAAGLREGDEVGVQLERGEG